MDFQDRFRHLNIVQEAVYILNSSREIMFGNLAAIELFGEYQAGQDIVQSIRNPRCLELISEVMHGSANSEESVKLGPPADGLFNVRISKFSEPGVAGDLHLLSLRDVNERQQAETMRSDFVANVSHELRSPLSTISGFIETLKGPAKNDPDARERFLGLMEQEADRMVRLISDLLSLSKVEANERQQPTAMVDLAAVVLNVHSSLAGLAKAKKKSIELNLPNEAVSVSGNQDELTQVVQNLLENAIKYSGSESRVTVSLTTGARPAGLGGPAVELRVSDEGPGIARQHIARLTERFYRIDTHRSRDDGGTGLGLAIVKHIVQRHRGLLKIDSELDKGSRFSVFLPMG